MSDELVHALGEAVTTRIHDGTWSVVAIASGRAVPNPVRQWLREMESDTEHAVLVVIEPASAKAED